MNISFYLEEEEEKIQIKAIEDLARINVIYFYILKHAYALIIVNVSNALLFFLFYRNLVVLPRNVC